MTELQNVIIGKIIMDASVATVPVTEDWIAKMVAFYENQASAVLGFPILSDDEKKSIITNLHSRLFIKIDRGHYLKEQNHVPWYMAAKAKQSNCFWDRYKLYLQKEKHWNKI